MRQDEEHRALAAEPLGTAMFRLLNGQRLVSTTNSDGPRMR